MKFFGHANLQQNELQAAVLPLDTRFPDAPKVGRLAFVNQVLYICVSIANDLPVWVPLTKEITIYTHNQTEPATTWTVNHYLNTTSVQVQVFDDQNRVVLPDEIVVNDANTVTVTVNTPAGGRAVVLTGHNDGSPKPTYSYIHYQQDPSAAWVVNHNLGREPIARVFVGNQEVQPLSITHNNNNTLTVNFSALTAGIVKVV